MHSKPKTFLVPERERTDPPPVSPWGLIHRLVRYKDREIIAKCGLDAYFFLRYLQTLLVVFIPVALVTIPILLPVNFVDGIGREFNVNATNDTDQNIPTGLDTIAWGNIKPENTGRRWAHLILALVVIIWVCTVVFAEMRVYIKIRQDYLTSAEHRLRASANTVLVSGIPNKWLSEEALRGLFDVFPGGIRNIWLTRDFTKLLDKVRKREEVHIQLEGAQSDLIRDCKRKQLKARAAEEKKARKEHKIKTPSKAEKAQRQKEEDVQARRQAEAGGGLTAGDHEEVPQVDDIVDETARGSRNASQTALSQQPQAQQSSTFKIPVIGGGLAKVGQGILGGVGAVGKAGQGVLGGAKAVGQGVDGQLERTGGFEHIRASDDVGPSSKPPTRGSDRPRKVVMVADEDEKPKASFASEPGRSRHMHTESAASQQSTPRSQNFDPRQHGNTVRKIENWDDFNVTEDSRWWQFWLPPSGAYASPVPQTVEGEEFPMEEPKENNKSVWAKIKGVFTGPDEVPVDYPSALNDNHPKGEKEEGAEWQKWLKQSDRPTHRLPIFDWTPSWLPGLPGINKKVDTIYWCREELARLNMEIEEDQQHPERYTPMNSAFIQFNNQVAAHMACQCVAHHIPKHMAPRMVEISPNDVIWDNMAITWWNEWLRTIAVIGIVFGMTILWAFPVAFSSSLAQVDTLIDRLPFLGFLDDNPTTYKAVQAICGVLPAILLAVLLILVPIIMDVLAGIQGAKTGAQKSEYVQKYYFFFLFVQVFLVVSIAGGAIATLQDTVNDIQSIPNVLAKNLPKSSNYFFSYMILQALSTSSGALLQIGTLVVWFVVSRILDNTARNKWQRQTTLPNITWGSFFPVYTNFACIALIYSIIAPLISIFAIITFSLLWFAQRYNMIYVNRFKIDTGGVLYPRALNQTFVGLYFMELCLVGLFFLVEGQGGGVACRPQAIIMIVAIILTAIYQLVLNLSFGPLLRYLPITFEDEAVLRDEAFQRAQDRRLGLVPASDEASSLRDEEANGSDTDIELRKLEHKGRQGTGGKLSKLNPVKGIVHAGTWAANRGKRARKATIGKAEENLRTAAEYRRARRQKDLEAQRAIGEALYGGYNDEIEDLTPEERDALVREAFKHSALRARRPTVWIPRDDLGVSDDEILRTREVSDYIWITNEGTALDSKVRVVYGRAPPDFSDLELINL
jgi:calcium permeable stress-gated cation channel